MTRWCALCLALALIEGAAAAVSPQALTVEYRTDPVGIDAARPRLSWNMAAAEGARNARQSAYRVIVASSREGLEKSVGDLWDSGKVVSERSLNVEYSGRTIPSSARVWWKVRTWDATGVESDWSAPAHWTQGLMRGWRAKWIGFGANPQPAFVRRFQVKPGLRFATLHLTGLGYYVAWANDVRIGDKVLDPSPTKYDRRVLYSTYEIERLLKEGENELRVILGRGWYDVPVDDTWRFEVAPWRDRPRMIAQLELEYADGTKETVVSDNSWRTVVNPVAYDSLREGETVGAAGPRQIAGAAAELVSAPKGRLQSEAQPGSKIVRELKPTAVRETSEGTLVSFAENVAGFVRVRARGLKAGAVVSVRYDERIGEDGGPASNRVIDVYSQACGKDNPFPETVFQCDHFVATGAAEEVFEPYFGAHGFQHVLVKGLSASPHEGDFVACVVHTDFEQVGRFESSSEMLNRLMAAANLSYVGNFVNGFPTDCPHREKNGWTGDAALASEMAQYNFENTAAYEKWLRDVCDTQVESGKIPGIVPASIWGGAVGRTWHGPVWDPLPIIAWNLWVYRGDKRILEETYAAIVKDIAYQDSEADEDGLVARGIGDWCPVDKAHAASNRFASSCYYYLAQTLAARIADVLERNADARRFATGAERTRQGILRRLFDRDALRFDNGFQTAQSMAVSLGVVDAATARTLASRLADALAADGFRFDAGTLGSRHLFRALSAFGWDDAALKTLLKETGHSFADWIRRGSTTLWEDFDDGRSRNHIMYGDFSAWAYEYLAGIRPGGEVPAIAEAEEPGFKTFLLAPHVPASLDFVTAETRTPYGVVKSAWRREGAGVRYSFVIPPNTTARIVLPEGDEGVRGSGEWVWVKGGAGK